MLQWSKVRKSMRCLRWVASVLPRFSGCRHSPACSPRIRLVAKEEAVVLLARRLTRWPHGNASAPIARATGH